MGNGDKEKMARDMLGIFLFYYPYNYTARALFCYLVECGGSETILRMTTCPFFFLCMRSRHNFVGLTGSLTDFVRRNNDQSGAGVKAES